jgi:hypothetical protein
MLSGSGNLPPFQPMKFQLITLSIAAALCCIATPAAATQVVGWVERARIHPGDMVFLAKLDTGALSSSINARNIELFRKDGKTWVRFEVVNRRGESTKLELPRLRSVRIKNHLGKRHARPVVLLGICLGNSFHETQVSLVDRGSFLYPLLIGRRFLAHGFAVDSSVKFTTPPDCPAPADPPPK